MKILVRCSPKKRLNTKIVATDLVPFTPRPESADAFEELLIQAPFVVESATEKHLEGLTALARLFDTVRLNPEDLPSVVQRAGKAVQALYQGAWKLPRDATFLFVQRNLNTGHVIGTSGIVYEEGDPAECPYWYYVRQGGKLLLTRHTEVGPTTFGGMVVHPDFRRTPNFPFGKFGSWVRATFVIHHPSVFNRVILSEIVPVLWPSPFWEHYGSPVTYKDPITGEHRQAVTHHELGKVLRVPEVAKRLSEVLPRELPISVLPEEIRGTLYEFGAKGAARNLLQIGFVHRGSFYPIDLGLNLEAEPQDLLFHGTVVQETPLLARNRGDLNSIGMVMMVRQVDGEYCVRFVLSPYGLSGAQPLLPAQTLEKLEIGHGKRTNQVSVIPIPRRLLEKFGTSS